MTAREVNPVIRALRRGGIEITAVVDGRDVHVLGYFIDPDSAALAAFLGQQRLRRIERVRQMIDRLKSLGIVLDALSPTFVIALKWW